MEVHLEKAVAVPDYDGFIYYYYDFGFPEEQWV